MNKICMYLMKPYPFTERTVLQIPNKMSDFFPLLGLTHYHTIPILMQLRYKAVENIVRKGEIACTKQFLLFSQCFLPYM